MRIAIYEPSLRVCGPVAHAFFIRQGFRDLGHECDIVSFTKSGRSRKYWGVQDIGQTHGFAWWSQEPDVVAKFTESTEVLDGYDLVILTEPKCAPHDRDMKKQDLSAPAYIEVLRRTKTPWTTILHGPQYDVKRASSLEMLLQTDGFLGFVITPHRDFANERFEGVEVVEHQPLPFVPKYALDDPVPTQKVIGMGGRIVPNKGPQMVASLIDEYPPGWNVELHGASAVMLGPAFTWILWEVMHGLGYDGWHEGFARDPHPVRRPYKWKVENEEKSRYVAYEGGYTNAAEVFNKFSVHVNLTSRNFSYGMIEFVGLEALDAGCIGVYPSHLLTAGPYDVLELTKYTVPPGIKFDKDASKEGRDAYDPWVRFDRLAEGVKDEYLTAVNTATELVGTETHREMARFNRELIARLHDPKVWCERVLDYVPVPA